MNQSHSRFPIPDIRKRDTEIEKLKKQLGREKRKSSASSKSFGLPQGSEILTHILFLPECKCAEDENNDHYDHLDENGVPYESEEDDESTIHYQALVSCASEHTLLY